MSAIRSSFRFATATLLLTLGTPLAQAQVVCGDTLTTSVQLTANLTCTGQRGLVVGADKITIDLNGFTLAGDGDVGDVGIDNGLGFDGLVIKNGTITDFDEAISLGGDAQKNAVTSVTIQFSLNDAIDLNDSDFTKISKCTLLNNGAGVQISTNGTGNVVEKSFIIGSAQAGVTLQGDGNLVQKNQLSSNGSAVRVLGSNNRVLANTVDRAVGSGIDVVGGTANLVSKNTATGCNGDGITVRNAPGAIVKQNVTHGNGNYGIGVFGTSDGTVVEKNQARANALSGVTVEDANGVRVDANITTGNRQDGVFLLSTTASAAKNTANGNLAYGLRANTVAVDGGGNKATGNGDGNCRGFACK